MQRYKLLTIFFLIALLTLNVSCAPYWHKNVFSVVVYPKAHNGPGGGKEIYGGMNKEEVLSSIGEPDRKKAFKNAGKEIWVYSRIAVVGEEISLTFINDKLTNIDVFRLEGFF